MDVCELKGSQSTVTFRDFCLKYVNFLCNKIAFRYTYRLHYILVNTSQNFTLQNIIISGIGDEDSLISDQVKNPGGNDI